MPGAAIRRPQDLGGVAGWFARKADPVNDSVSDSTLTNVIQLLARALSADDPSGQMMGMMTTGIPSAGKAGGIAGKLIDAYRGAKASNAEWVEPTWFTTDVDEANVYSGSVSPTAKLFGDKAPLPPPKPGAQVQPVKVNVTNPKKVAFAQIANATKETLDRARAEGFDALMYEHKGKTWYVPVSNADQVKPRFSGK